jgi:adenine-specific DNA glycosylase
MKRQVADGTGSGPTWLEDSRQRAAFRRRLLAWYHRHRRDLPRRRSDDPYAVWLSEVMLQQTRVATAQGYYERFLQRFPTITDLAVADEEEFLKAWEGLGYYSRSQNLHCAARAVVADHDGILLDARLCRSPSAAAPSSGSTPTDWTTTQFRGQTI